MFDQMPEDEKQDAREIEGTLLETFALGPFEAYNLFRQRSWTPGEAVDVYLADLRRLARLAKVENDSLLKCAFVVGLPAEVSAWLKSSSRIQDSELEELSDVAMATIR